MSDDGYLKEMPRHETRLRNGKVRLDQHDQGAVVLWPDAVAAVGKRDAEIAKLRAELAAEVENARLIAQNLADARRALKVVEAERDRRGRALVAHGVEIEKHDYTSYKAPVPVVTAAEIRTYMDKLADQPRTGGYVPPAAPPAESHRAWPPAAEIAKWVDDWHAGKIPTPIEPAPPAADPRVDALCRVVVTMANMHWPKEWGLSLSPLLHADLETIGARR